MVAGYRDMQKQFVKSERLVLDMEEKEMEICCNGGQEGGERDGKRSC